MDAVRQSTVNTRHLGQHEPVAEGTLVSFWLHMLHTRLVE